MLPPDAPSVVKAALETGLPSPPGDWVGSVVGGAVWGLGMLVASVVGLYRYLSGHNRASKIAPEEELMVKSVDLVDTSALSQKIIAYLSPKMDDLAVGGQERDRTLEMILKKLQHIENEQEIARRARDEVQRQLLERRENDRWRMSSDK